MTSNYEYSIKTCAADRDMWEQQPNESDDRYAMFVYYRELGIARTLDLVATKFGKAIATIRNYSTGCLWRIRVNAYDRERFEQRGNKLESDAIESNLRTIKALDELEHFAYHGLVSRDVSEFSNMELIKLIDSVHTNKAKYIGMPTYRPDSGALGNELPVIAADAAVRDEDLKNLVAEFARRNPETLQIDEPGND